MSIGFGFILFLFFVYLSEANSRQESLKQEIIDSNEALREEMED